MASRSEELQPRSIPEIVVITGASAGIGRAIVRELAHRRGWIGLLARDRSRLDLACAELEQSGGRAIGLVADVADDAQVEEAAETVERRFGPIDIWINNAMVSVLSPALAMSPANIVESPR